MIFISKILSEDREFGEDTFFIYSDKSEHEVKTYISVSHLFYTRHHTKELGAYYTLKMSSFQTKRLFSKLEKKGLPTTEENILNLKDTEHKVISYSSWVDKRKTRVKNRVSSNLNVINAEVVNFLNKEYDFTHLEKEYSHSSLNVRADFFGVTIDRKVVTVEVKSDKDTLARLEKQLRAYKVFSHMVYVATDIKHLLQVEKLVDKIGDFTTIGVLVYEDGILWEKKKPYHMQAIDATRLLWKDEHKKILYGFDIPKINLLGIHALVDISVNIFTVKEYRELSEYLFTERYIKKNKLDYILELYKHKQHKQKIINSIIEK